MRGKISRGLLGLYDLFLAAGAIYQGSKMVLGLWWNGEKFPELWLSKVPFASWFWSGVIAIVVYGLGNIIAAIYSFSRSEKGCVPSLSMGIVFFISLIVSIYVLGEGYLATFMFIILAVIQIILTLITAIVMLIANKGSRG